MKKFIQIAVAFFCFIVMFIVPAIAQEVADQEKQKFFMELLIENAVYITPILIWLINRFIPTKYRDPLVMFLEWLNTLLPDKKSGGGKHNDKK